MAGLNKNDIEQISLLQNVIPPTLYTTHYTITAATSRAENGIEIVCKWRFLSIYQMEPVIR